ncbi:MAG: DUF1598 domain-containing protein [Pirellulaceae bacterium]|nr:DUF1598 domain-containing protein [Pirellulaceae bacterium]
MKRVHLNGYSLVCIFLVCFSQAICLGQSDSDSPGARPKPSTPIDLNAARPMSQGQGGGGGMADFDSLIQIINTMVPSGDWDLGENTIERYPNGVWIDPNGKLHRQKTSVSLRVPSAANTVKPDKFFEVPQLGALQTSETIRWVSLVDLENTLNEKRAQNVMASPSMELLGGLTRIDYVARNPETGDWYLGGPAGDLVLDRKGNLVGRSTGLPPVLLEDLLSIAPAVLNGRGPMGVSIDPVPERLKAASDFVASPIAKKSLTQNHAKFCDRLTETLGDQQATVFGLPKDSPTGVALLVADEHMKRIGLGLENGPAKLRSYWEEADKRGAIQSSGLIRWWFALRDDIQIGVNDSETVYSIESPTVRVMSQKQWMDHTGARREADSQDPAADAFATGFTEQFNDLQAMYPAYGRLRHIFDLSVALRLIREEVQAGRGEPLSMLMDRSIQPHASEPIQWIPSVAAWHKTSNGRVAAIVSGGVAIDVKKASIDRQTGRKQPTNIKAFAFE